MISDLLCAIGLILLGNKLTVAQKLCVLLCLLFTLIPVLIDINFMFDVYLILSSSLVLALIVTIFNKEGNFEYKLCCSLILPVKIYDLILVVNPLLVPIFYDNILTLQPFIKEVLFLLMLTNNVSINTKNFYNLFSGNIKQSILNYIFVVSYIIRF